MSEYDELRRLSDADPVDPASIPSAEDPGPRALMERIVMEGTSKPRLRTRAGAITAAAAVVLVVTGGVVLATRETKPKDPGPVTPPGQALCVELYSLETLAKRAVAFDGTVKSVAGDQVTFTVGQWFKGGTATEITLEGASTLGGITSAGPTVSLEPGTRLLVAGDDGFAWSCGFTQPYDAGVAASWRTTFG